MQERMQVLSEARDLPRVPVHPRREDRGRFGCDARREAKPRSSTGRSPLLARWATGARGPPRVSVLRKTLIEDGGCTPRDAFGPLRSAISGRRISPPLFESMELLGKDSIPRAAAPPP